MGPAADQLRAHLLAKRFAAHVIHAAEVDNQRVICMLSDIPRQNRAADGNGNLRQPLAAGAVLSRPGSVLVRAAHQVHVRAGAHRRDRVHGDGIGSDPRAPRPRRSGTDRLARRHRHLLGLRELRLQDRPQQASRLARVDGHDRFHRAQDQAAVVDRRHLGHPATEAVHVDHHRVGSRSVLAGGHSRRLRRLQRAAGVVRPNFGERPRLVLGGSSGGRSTGAPAKGGGKAHA